VSSMPSSVPLSSNSPIPAYHTLTYHDKTLQPVQTCWMCLWGACLPQQAQHATPSWQWHHSTCHHFWQWATGCHTLHAYDLMSACTLLDISYNYSYSQAASTSQQQKHKLHKQTVRLKH